ncbi:unnamed protein product [Arctia plantaginis]|uniref:Uncharacterized protein n=1 Tax=Arctia plantaginis TaxID=874455 RepID=A0A8S0ZD31_ARCPL|nr:unnamed protein product [Arctia plantaginis]
MRPSDACAATSAVFPLALRARGVSELGHDRDPPNAMYAGFSKRPLAADSGQSRQGRIFSRPFGEVWR